MTKLDSIFSDLLLDNMPHWKKESKGWREIQKERKKEKMSDNQFEIGILLTKKFERQAIISIH